MTVRPAEDLVADLRLYGADCEVTEAGGLRVLDPSLAPDELVAEIGRRWSEVVVALRCPSLPKPAQRCPSPPNGLEDGVWAVLLSLVPATDKSDPLGLYGVLSGLRAMGARLELSTVDGVPKLRLYSPPGEDPTAVSDWLGDHREALGELLRQAGAVVAAEAGRQEGAA